MTGPGRPAVAPAALDTSRIASLDMLRGIAVMGILVMNLPGFALPDGAYFNPAGGGGTRPADVAAWAVGFVLFDGKLRSLFSMLFGASMLLVIAAAGASGRNAAATHYRRMFWLFLFGLVHFAVVWRGDILGHYALVCCIAFLFAGCDPRTLLRAAAGLYGAQLLSCLMLITNLMATRGAAQAPHAPLPAIAAWQDLTAYFGRADGAHVASQIALHRGPLALFIRDGLHRWSEPFQFLLFGGWETLGLMLIGMAGLKTGFLSGGWDRSRYLRLAGWAYLLSVPPTLALAVLAWWSGFDTIGTAAAALLGGVFLRPVMAGGHAALALAWLDGPATALKARIAAAGRMAFSNYLGTSLVMTALFQGWGLGLYDRIGRAELYLLVPPTWVAMLLWSKPWLDHYRFGPLEWLWRSLARHSWQPMRKSIAMQSQ